MGNFCSSPLGQIDAGKEIILIEKAQGADSQVIPSDGGNSILLLACRDVPGTAAFALAAPIARRVAQSQAFIIILQFLCTNRNMVKYQ